MTNTFSVPEHGTFALPTEADTAKFGAALAKVSQPGDIFLLKGSLGAGKTTFARGFIQYLAGADEEVVSPTFTLVQTYESARGVIWHFDLYRIDEPDDVLELGLEEAQIEGISLIEWPERLGPYAPRTPLEIEISSASDGASRQIRLSGEEKWRDRLIDLASRVC